MHSKSCTWDCSYFGNFGPTVASSEGAASSSNSEDNLYWQKRQHMGQCMEHRACISRNFLDHRPILVSGMVDTIVDIGVTAAAVVLLLQIHHEEYDVRDDGHDGDRDDGRGGEEAVGDGEGDEGGDGEAAAWCQLVFFLLSMLDKIMGVVVLCIVWRLSILFRRWDRGFPDLVTQTLKDS